jgi:hypothetical protein
LYINQKNDRFKDELVDRIQKTSMSSMSSDLGDINNDGYPDIFTTDMIPDDDYRLKTTGTFDNVELYNSKQRQGLHHQFVKNCLQLNNQNGSFLEMGNYAGVSGTDWSWGAVFLDADNDGNTDLFVCNGINRDVGDLDFLDYFSNDVYKKMMETGKRQKINELLQHIPSTPLANRVFKNNGHLNFTDARKVWGFEKPSFSNSIAYADLDNDGDLDLVINNENQPAFVYRNNSREQNRHHFIGVNLKGRGENTFVVGAKIKVYRGAELLSREVMPSRGFQSSVEYKQLIGLGTSAVVDSMVVIWPDRTCSRFLHPAIDTVHQLQQPEKPGPLYNFEATTLAKTLLEPVPNNMEAHRENDYVDFYAERNLPAMLSREGPRLARADVNGDGLEDLYIGGAKGQAGQLYLQTLQGTFIEKPCAAFDQYKDFEDVAVLFFDADKDGDQDLFVGAGGNESSLGSRELQHRLYKNDGKGNFTIDTKAFTTNSNNISTAAAYDFDDDGDLDLFVGSRSVPFAYGITPESYLYKNDGHGNFTDIAPKLTAQLSPAGMVTAAVWADVTGDQNKELIITGEWMAPKIFAYKHGKMQLLQNTGLDDLYGWWQSVTAADLNGDGLQDLILGNIGENFYLHPDKKNPVKLWLNDFDGNGSAEGFLTRTVAGKDMPVFLKREVTDQFPALKKQNLRHSSYAIKTVQELFAPELIQKARVKNFNYCSSIVALNNGHGGFTISPLPAQAQLSSVGAVCSTDLNGDHYPDLIIGGNLYNFQPQFGRLDGCCGLVLLNDGKAKFTSLPPQQSGMNLKGEVKAIAEITSKGRRQIIVLQNNLQPQVFQIK